MGVRQTSLNALPLMTCADTLQMTQGPMAIITIQYAYYGKGRIVHSVAQLSQFGLHVDDQSSTTPGHKQCMITPDHWIILFHMVVNSFGKLFVNSKIISSLTFYMVHH